MSIRKLTFLNLTVNSTNELACFIDLLGIKPAVRYTCTKGIHVDSTTFRNVTGLPWEWCTVFKYSNSFS